jgi:hypothetical protein
MNNQGISKISIIFFSIVFIILWALFFAGQLSTWGNVAIVNGGYTGIEAFFYANINLMVGIIFFIAILSLGSVAE